MVRIAVSALAIAALLGCDPTTPTGSVDADTAVDMAADCQVIYDGRTICFPVDHVCTDPHGIGDGVPIEIDCHTAGSRMCHPNAEQWPECAGGWEQQ